MAMKSLVQTAGSESLRSAFLASLLVGLALVLLGWWLVPQVSLVSVGGVGLILLLYGVTGFFLFPRLRPEVLPLVARSGLLAGAIFAAEILLEYAILPKDNTSWGAFEFGGVFAVYFFCSLVAATRGGFRQGILAAAGSAMLSSVIWLIVVLLTFYVFRGSARQAQVFLAEGNYADFARSGMSDFNQFVMEDFFGAGFYHLLLGPLAAVLLGTPGALLGKLLGKRRGVK